MELIMFTQLPAVKLISYPHIFHPSYFPYQEQNKNFPKGMGSSQLLAVNALSCCLSLCQPISDSPSRSQQRLLLLHWLPVIFRFRDPVFLFPMRPSLRRWSEVAFPPSSSSTVNWYTLYLFPSYPDGKQFTDRSLDVFTLGLLGNEHPEKKCNCFWA